MSMCRARSRDIRPIAHANLSVPITLPAEMRSSVNAVMLFSASQSSGVTCTRSSSLPKVKECNVAHRDMTKAGYLMHSVPRRCTAGSFSVCKVVLAVADFKRPINCSQVSSPAGDAVLSLGWIETCLRPVASTLSSAVHNAAVARGHEMVLVSAQTGGRMMHRRVGFEDAPSRLRATVTAFEE
jgi:hypothetical protein